MTNPDNIVRVRARNGGRASVYEANGWCQAYGSGILEGTGVVQNTVANMTVLVGGSSSKPDVLVAQNPAGYKIALDLVGQQPVTITAPASNSRISTIVAYTDDLALESTEDTVTGSPASCGLIVVNGSTSASPSAPTDTQIRNAITSDGATGSQASYAIIATIRVASNTTTITDALITRNQAGVQSSKIDFATSTVFFSNAENIGSTPRTVASYTIEKAGKYFIFMNADINCLGLDLGDANLAILKNSSNVQNVYFNNPQGAYFIGGIQLFTVQECNPGDVISVRGTCSKNRFSINVSENRTNLQIIRIS